MIATRAMNEAQLSFQTEDGDPGQLLVLRYRGTEGLCQLYRFEIELMADAGEVEIADLVGKSASLALDTEHGQRWFHGIISRFELTDEHVDRHYYRAELVPQAWLLTQRYDSRIFQHQSVPDIITAVLSQAGIQSDRFRFMLQESYDPIEYCVQYRETDYNFICRLMEENGIWWFFEHTEDGHVLVIADSSTAYAAIEGESSTLAYVAPSATNTPDEAHISRFRLGQSIRPGAVTLNDFTFEAPKLDLKASSDCGRDTNLGFYDYPGEYASQAGGQQSADLRSEEFEAGRVLGIGLSNCQTLAPGRTFDLTEHSSASLNGCYLLTSVTHQGRQSATLASANSGRGGDGLGSAGQRALSHALNSGDPQIRELAEGLARLAARLDRKDPTAHRELSQWVYHAGQVSRDLANIAAALGGHPASSLSIPNLLDDPRPADGDDFGAAVYSCVFQCIPAGVTYRPPRVTPWPVMRGTQTARVVGPTSEEIYTDEYGRVKVQFHWDRAGQFDENSSCWIRVSQGLAGGQYGMMFLPHVGQEVIVDFLEGNPDQPLIVGRVYNADHKPPYSLPAEKTKSCIKTSSTQGGGGTNEIRFEDLKDSEQILVYAQKDLHLRANNDRVANVGRDDHLTVEQNQHALVKQNRHSEITLDLKEKVGGNTYLEIGGDLTQEVNGNQYAHVGNQHYLLADGKLVIESGEAITLKVGGNFIKISSSGIYVMGTVVHINSEGSADNGTALALKSPEAPIDADAADPGQDTRYGPQTSEPSEPASEEDKETSWIEIELVDEAGQPWPNEPYEIIAPDGKVKTGSLDQNGQAHVAVSDPGDCQISFPNLDRRAWERN